MKQDWFLYAEYSNIPLLAFDTWAGPYCCKYLLEMRGAFVDVLMYWVDGEMEVLFYSEESNQRMASIAKEMLEEDPKVFHKEMDKYSALRPMLIKKFEELDDMDLSKLSNEDLWKLYDEYQDLVGVSAARDWYTFSFDNLILDAVGLEEYFNKHPDQKQEILSHTQPDAVLHTQEEELAVLRLATKCKGLTVEEIKLNFSEELEKISGEFGWISALMIYPTKSAEKYASDVEKMTQEENVESHIQHLEDFVMNNRKKLKVFIDEKNPPEKVVVAIEAIKKLSEIRAVGELDTIHWHNKMRRVDSEIQKRTGINSKDYWVHYMREIKDALVNGTKLDVSSRHEIAACYRDSQGRMINVGNAKELYQKIKSKESESEELRGMPGFAGKVKGKVHLIHSSQDVDKFKEGEILVAKSTCVDYVVIMKKAGAIVTQYGGVTSHAAVVSRELGVPSIIGVPNVTEVLKNGDMVEVDAINGIVNIL